ncbi:MAG: hypothetical protein AAF975_01075, partial [Spirochaetota bacterium]
MNAKFWGLLFVMVALVLPGCRLPSGEKSSTEPSSRLDFLRSYRVQYSQINGGEQFVSAHWNGNILTLYNPDKSRAGSYTFDELGRIVRNDSTAYRYEGAGNSRFPYRKKYANAGLQDEFLVEEVRKTENGWLVTSYIRTGTINVRETYDTQERLLKKEYFMGSDSVGKEERYQYEGTRSMVKLLDHPFSPVVHTKNYLLQKRAEGAKPFYKYSTWEGSPAFTESIFRASGTVKRSRNFDATGRP